MFMTYCISLNDATETPRVGAMNSGTCEDDSCTASYLSDEASLMQVNLEPKKELEGMDPPLEERAQDPDSIGSLLGLEKKFEKSVEGKGGMNPWHGNRWGGNKVSEWVECPKGSFINTIHLKKGNHIDKIEKITCTNGQPDQSFNNCGGGGGIPCTVQLGPAGQKSITLRAAAVIDSIGPCGSNGGEEITYQCGRHEEKITGVKARCGEVVDAIQFRCND